MPKNNAKISVINKYKRFVSLPKDMPLNKATDPKRLNPNNMINSFFNCYPNAYNN